MLEGKGGRERACLWYLDTCFHRLSFSFASWESWNYFFFLPFPIHPKTPTPPRLFFTPFHLPACQTSTVGTTHAPPPGVRCKSRANKALAGVRTAEPRRTPQTGQKESGTGRIPSSFFSTPSLSLKTSLVLPFSLEKALASVSDQSITSNTTSFHYLVTLSRRVCAVWFCRANGDTSSPTHSAATRTRTHTRRSSRLAKTWRGTERSRSRCQGRAKSQNQFGHQLQN